MAKFWFRLARVRKQLQLPIIECSALPPSKPNLTNSLSTLSVKNEPHRFPLYSLCQKTNLTGSLSTLSVKNEPHRFPLYSLCQKTNLTDSLSTLSFQKEPRSPSGRRRFRSIQSSYILLSAVHPYTFFRISAAAPFPRRLPVHRYPLKPSVPG